MYIGDIMVEEEVNDGETDGDTNIHKAFWGDFSGLGPENRGVLPHVQMSKPPANWPPTETVPVPLKPPPKRPQQSQTTGRGHRHNACQERQEAGQSVKAKETLRVAVFMQEQQYQQAMATAMQQH
jgi:hypothetical protein